MKVAQVAQMEIGDANLCRKIGYDKRLIEVSQVP